MNSASRILAIYQQMLPIRPAPGFSMRQLWMDVLQVPQQSDKHKVVNEVAARLSALLGELDATEEALSQLGCPEDLYKQQLERLKAAASPAVLNEEWQGWRPNLLPEDTRLALGWAAWHIPDDEEELAPEEVTKLLDELRALQEEIESSSMSPLLRRFVQKHLGTLRSALERYKIQGVKAVNEALEKAAGALVASKAALAEEARQAKPEAQTLFGRFGALVKRAAQVAESVEKIHKGIEGAKGIATALGGAWDTVAPVLGSALHSS